MAILIRPFTAPVVGPILWMLVVWGVVAGAVLAVTR